MLIVSFPRVILSSNCHFIRRCITIANLSGAGLFSNDDYSRRVVNFSRGEDAGAAEPRSGSSCGRNFAGASLAYSVLKLVTGFIRAARMAW
jgi:hypothetical protein